MKKNSVSILITNYNKDKFLKRSIKSCISQNFLNKEIIVFDDCSNDNSKKILNSFKRRNFKVLYNKKKKYLSGPLNQLNGIQKIFSISKGNFIFLLDSDDFFRKNKIEYILKKFTKDKNINFIQDKPLYNKDNQIPKLKKKKHTFSIWPSFYPTSCIAIRREFFKKFLNNSANSKFQNLEIDARLCIYAFVMNEFRIINKSLTIYNYDQNGITSKYKKFSFNWWKKREEAFDFMHLIMKKKNMDFIPGFDYLLTKIINFLIRFIN